MRDRLHRYWSYIAYRFRKRWNTIQNIPITLDGAVSYFIFLLKIKTVNKESNNTINQVFYRKQFVAHGKYHLPYPNNSLVLYKELIEKGFGIIECDVMFTKDSIPILCHDLSLSNVARDRQGKYVDIEISKQRYSKIEQYNFSIEGDSYLPVSTLKDMLSLAKRHNVCIELDLNKKYLGRKKCKKLYNMVKNAGMLQNVIWEVFPGDFYSLAILDQNLIYQFDNTWDKKKIDRIIEIKDYASLIILSQWLPDSVSGPYNEIIEYGHLNGFLMKCATLNNYSDVDYMFSNGVDLITTDTLSNKY